MNLYFFLVGEMNMELMPEDFKPNTFYIDTRERKRVIDIKKFLFNFIENDALVYDKHKRPFKIQDAKLQIGDYAFMNDKGVSCGFEWKTIDDFRWSTNTNEDSVFRKTIDLINAYDSPHLIIQGDKRQVHNIKDYEMTINSMSHSLNIREPITQEMGLKIFSILIRHTLGTMDTFDTADVNKLVGKAVYCEVVHKKVKSTKDETKELTFANIAKILSSAPSTTIEEDVSDIPFAEEDDM